MAAELLIMKVVPLSVSPRRGDTEQRGFDRRAKNIVPSLTEYLTPARGGRMKPRISLRQSLQDPNLLGTAIARNSWRSWRTLLIAAMGNSGKREIFTQLTGREREPLQRIDVANAVAGAAALSKFGGYDTSLRWVSGDDDDSGAAWQRVRLQTFINSGGRIRL